METFLDSMGRQYSLWLPAKTGIIVNCEVKVERFGHGRLDIKIEAISKERMAPQRIALIIEVKR